MINRSSSGNRLGRQALLFPLCLVLYEFSTYIGNDMIQPGMLAVVEQYNAGIEWVPTSMTAYLAGGMFLQWLFGPLSDRIGRRPVMLTGGGRMGPRCAVGRDVRPLCRACGHLFLWAAPCDAGDRHPPGRKALA